MTLQSAFRAYISGVDAIAELVENRLYPVRGPDAPADNPPKDYAIYRFLNRRDMAELRSVHGAIAEVDLQIEHYSAAYDQAWEAMEAFKAALDVYLAGGEMETLHLVHCLFQSASDEDDPRFGLFCVRADYHIAWPPA